MLTTVTVTRKTAGKSDHTCPTEDYTQDINFVVEMSGSPQTCARCNLTLASRNKLFRHLEQCRSTSLIESPTPHDTHNASVVDEPRVVTSKITPNHTNGGPGYAFRGWQYAVVEAQLGDHPDKLDICVDSGNPVSMVGRGSLGRLLPNHPLQKMASAVPVRGIGGKVVKSDEFITMKLTFSGAVLGRPVKGVVTAEICTCHR